MNKSGLSSPKDKENVPTSERKFFKTKPDDPSIPGAVAPIPVTYTSTKRKKASSKSSKNPRKPRPKEPAKTKSKGRILRARAVVTENEPATSSQVPETRKSSRILSPLRENSETRKRTRNEFDFSNEERSEPESAPKPKAKKARMRPSKKSAKTRSDDEIDERPSKKRAKTHFDDENTQPPSKRAKVKEAVVVLDRIDEKELTKMMFSPTLPTSTPRPPRLSSARARSLILSQSRGNNVSKEDSDSEVEWNEHPSESTDDDDEEEGDVEDEDGGVEAGEDDEEEKPRKGKKKGKNQKKEVPGTKRKKKLEALEKKVGERSMLKRERKLSKSGVEKVRSKLHVSAVPDSLPCRENEFAEIFMFVESRLQDQTGGCMYISGVPGTGKTETVKEVLRCLKDSVDAGAVPPFRVLMINGMKLTDPKQAYVQILQQLTGKHCSPDAANAELDKYFSKRNDADDAVVLVIDELDLLWTRKQQVLYSLFEWPNRKEAKLVVLTISNTMDLPERMLMNRVTSRLGLTRLTFHPYTHHQLQEIVTMRLRDMNIFKGDAIVFASRKVAAISGDARRALDICRKAAEMVQDDEEVEIHHIQKAIQEMSATPILEAIRNLSSHEQLFIRAIVAETQRTKEEETTYGLLYQQYAQLCRLEGLRPLNASAVSRMCSALSSCRLVIAEAGDRDLLRRIRLNVSHEDVTSILQRIIS